MKYSICVDMIFSDREMEEKVNMTRLANSNAIEFWKWSNKDIDTISRKTRENALNVAVFNLDSSDETLSYDLSRGILNAGRSEEIIAALIESIPIYRKLEAKAMIVLIGEELGIPYEEQIQNILNCLNCAKSILEKENINLVVEPLNDIDRKKYLLPRSKEVFEIIRRVDSPNIKVLLDLYHEQLMAGNLINTIKENIQNIGHIHIADVPGRHEPGTGEINYKNILKLLSELNYQHYVGFEFRSTLSDADTIKCLRSIIS